MAASVSYRIVGYERVRNGLRRMASDYRETTDRTVGAWTKQERAVLKGHGYPPQRRAPQPFKSDRQRRYFFWALSQGIIVVPYPRSGRLANSWSAKQTGWSHWVLENSASYAALVVGDGTQSRYHAGHWWTAKDVIEGNVGELTRQLSKELEALAP